MWGTPQLAKEKFLSIGERRLLDMADLSNSAYRLYTLLLFKIRRNRNREPSEDSNPFLLKYKDFAEFKIPRMSFTRSIKELVKNGYIELTGTRERRLCKVVKW